MTLANKLSALYPDASPITDFNVVDHLDGRGPHIEFWNADKLGPMPTAEQIAAAPVPKRRIRRMEALERLTDAQLAALLRAAGVDPASILDKP